MDRTHDAFTRYSEKRDRSADQALRSSLFLLLVSSLLVSLSVLLAALAWAGSPAMVVSTLLQVAGQPAAEASIDLRPAGEERFQTRTLKLGDSIAQGSDLIVPPKTVVQLKTANGNLLTLNPGTRSLCVGPY